MHIVRFIAFMQLFIMIVKLKERHRYRPHSYKPKKVSVNIYTPTLPG